jgi:lipopolysaccharide transport system permease protein
VAQIAEGGEPSEYLIVIEPGRRRLREEIADLLHYCDLLYFLTRRDLSVRYKQTVLGVLWAILQPLLTMVVFSVFLGNLARVPSDGVPYPVFAYLGLLPWTYFSSAVTRGAMSLVAHANLLGKVYFPRVLIPLSATLSALVDFAIAAVILVGIMLYFDMFPAAGSILLLPLALLTALLALGVGMWLAALNVRYRDVQHATPFLMQIWMFATPVVYPGSLVPESYRAWFHLNPMAGIIAAYRGAVLGTPIDWQGLSISSAATLVFLGLGIWQFRRMDRFFADVV